MSTSKKSYQSMYYRTGFKKSTKKVPLKTFSLTMLAQTREELNAVLAEYKSNTVLFDFEKIESMPDLLKKVSIKASLERDIRLWHKAQVEKLQRKEKDALNIRLHNSDFKHYQNAYFAVMALFTYGNYDKNLWALEHWGICADDITKAELLWMDDVCCKIVFSNVRGTNLDAVVSVLSKRFPKLVFEWKEEKVIEN